MTDYPPAFPWATHLDRDDLTEFLGDLAIAASYVNPTEAIAEINRVAHEWRVTAEAIADPEVWAALTGPLEDCGFVEAPRPEGEQS